MFPNSRNVVITGGQWTNSNVINERTDYNNNGIDVLRRHSVPGATHDSGERFDPPKCDPDTRIMIIKFLTAWLKSSERSSPMLWLRGSAGVGKSALAQSFAELCATKSILAGTFFFSRTSANPKRSDGRSLFPIIAYQLVSSFPRTRKFINKAIEDDPSIFDQSLETQMRKLVIEPLNRIASSPMQRFLRFFIRQPISLIIVDGLDECSDPAIQCELLRIIGTSLRKFPFPFRFLIASRPEAHITRTFKVGLKAIPYNEIDLSEDFFAAEDIRIFLKKCFNDIKSTHILHAYIPPSWPSEDNISELVRRSSCQFIYASTVIKYISSPKHQPMDRLNVILGLSPRPVTDTPYTQLDALYMHILSCVDDIPTVLIILGILIISMEEGSTSAPAAIEKLLFLKPGDVELTLSDLLSVLTLEGPHQSIRILHASLPDFLVDPSRSGDFYVDVGMSHAALARGYMRNVSEVTYDLTIMRYTWDPIMFHLNKAVLTEALHQDLLDFNFFTILCRSNFQIQPSATGKVDSLSTTEFQGYVMWWICSFLSCVGETEAFRHSKDIYDRHMRTFDEHLKGQLLDYLSHQDLVDALTLLSIYDNGLTPNAISLCIPEFLESAIDSSERQLVRIIDENGLNIRTLCARENAAYSGQQSYLVLLGCFLRDPNRSGEDFIDDVKYAHAAIRCLKAVCVDIPKEEEVGDPVISKSSTLEIEHAYMECIAALLPKAAIAEDLLSLIVNNTILAGILHRKQGVVVFNLAAQLEAYLERSNRPGLTFSRARTVNGTELQSFEQHIPRTITVRTFKLIIVLKFSMKP